jgi:hypothetical protein
MLAFLAMMMITIASMNYFQAEMRTNDNMIRSEYEIMANASTIEQMEVINQTVDWDDLFNLDGDSSTVTYGVDAFSVDFAMEVDVQYVTVTGAASATPTSYKEVSLTASNDKYSVDLVTHTRIFAE